MGSGKPLEVELVAIEISNLRGFKSARLSLREGLSLLVGPNNSGKTSVLRILDWVLNRAREETLLGTLPLDREEFSLLVPARRTGGTARRITLHVDIADGRRRRRFQATGRVARLRIGVNAEGYVRLNLGPPKRNEAPDNGVALELLRAVRRCTEYGLVPASRDARSESFTAAFRDAVTARLENRAIHARRAGAPAEYRQVKKALAQLERIGKELVAPLWVEMQENLPPGLAERGELRVSVLPEDFVPWLADRVGLRLVTGPHDADSVAPIEVGSGLQSLLELATQQAAASVTGERRIIAVEEPEAFLHPSAQRTLARLIAKRLPGKRIVSTHSPLLVEEASYGEVVLVRDHRFYEPSGAAASDPDRNDINTALLSGYGAEMAFARSVLLVEGEGDRLYFEWLRRRLAVGSNDGRLDEIYVLPTGSKASFAPWLKLFSSYGREGDRPVRWLASPDSDGATQIRRAWHDAGFTIPLTVSTALTALANTARSERATVVRRASAVNAAAAEAETAIEVLPIDLEHVMLSSTSHRTVRQLCRLLGAPEMTAEALETWLRNRKAPWMRAVIARETPVEEVSPMARSVLRRWLEPVTGDDTESVLASMQEAERNPVLT